MQLNENIKLLPESGVSVTGRVADFQAANPSATLIRLDQDLMNMPLPPKVTEEMKRAVDEVGSPFGVRLSGPWDGYESLKKEVVEHLAGHGVTLSESEVFITSGLESANACLSQLFGQENTVLLPDPALQSQVRLQQSMGRTLSFSRALPENGFCPDPPAEGVDLIYLASPDPVTGVAMDREKLEKWVNFAKEHDSVIFYDSSLSEYLEEETYPHSIYEIEGARDCAIELFSFESGYGVRELKIAYVIIPSCLTREGERLSQLFCARQPVTATPPSFVMQKAAQMLFSPEAREETKKILYRIKKVGRTLSAGLTAAGIPHVGGERGPFLWAQCPEGMSAWQCFDRILSEAACVVTPGTLFGYGGERYFRLTAFGMPDEAQEAVERLAHVFKKEEKNQEVTPRQVEDFLFSDPQN